MQYASLWTVLEVGKTLVLVAQGWGDSPSSRGQAAKGPLRAATGAEMGYLNDREPGAAILMRS